MYWFNINKILMEQEFNFLNGINKLFHEELCLLPKRARHVPYQIMPCPTPVPMERLFLWPCKVEKSHSSHCFAGSPTHIFTVQLVKVSDFSFCSSCFSYWGVALIMKTSYQVGKLGDVSVASHQLSCCIIVQHSMGFVISEDC